MRALLFSSLLLSTISICAANQLEIDATVDGTEQIVITQTNASLNHLSGDLSLTTFNLNGIVWMPSRAAVLPNSGATVFLTNSVNFLFAEMDVISARDTLVLEREASRVVVSIADTPAGPGNYHFIISFPSVPTLTVSATIDGSDELHISYSGARWLHKQWGSPSAVSLNEVAWNPSSRPYLTNSELSLFLPEPVHFENATVLSTFGRGLMTVRPSWDGLIINFADDAIGAGKYQAVIGFPPNGVPPNASLVTFSSASISPVPGAGIEVQTVRGVVYELQSTTNIASGVWRSTGSFIRGNGGSMTLFDPINSTAPQFYRIVSLP